jgi:hypothetical protein
MCFFHISALEPKMCDALLTEFEHVQDISAHSFHMIIHLQNLLFQKSYIKYTENHSKFP